MAEEESFKCIFPKCPKCGKGCLLPFSYKEDVFEKWKCSNPECDFVVQKKRLFVNYFLNK